jgi:hypothetical protein
VAGWEIQNFLTAFHFGLNLCLSLVLVETGKKRRKVGDEHETGTCSRVQKIVRSNKLWPRCLLWSGVSDVRITGFWGSYGVSLAPYSPDFGGNMEGFWKINTIYVINGGLDQ